MEAFRRRYRPQADDYRQLHRWSVAEPAEFWRAVAEYCAIDFSVPAAAVLVDEERMPGASWFSGARLNYAQNLLGGDDAGAALIFVNERLERRVLNRRELRRQVAASAAWLRSAGVVVGDRVAGVLPNGPEAVVAALAAASIGAIWSSCSPDFGSAALFDRLGQVAPKVLFGSSGYFYNGKSLDCRPTLAAVASSLPSLTQIVMVDYGGVGVDLSDFSVPAVAFTELLRIDAEPQYQALPFDHPLFIMFSSGTTGKPKCIVHGAGGTLLQHKKEHLLHTDIKPGDRLFFFTTCGWMMWNWLLSGLASGATLVLYDGAPMHPDPGVLWQIAAAEEVDVFGTSARYLSALEQRGYRPREHAKLGKLRAILSTGSPLAPQSFDFVSDAIGQQVQTASIAGGTDIISCFMLGNPCLPVHRGEIQCLGLGMDVQVFDQQGLAVTGQKGELVCTKPFPSMPIGFLGDPDQTRYLGTYFERYPNVWCHGDYVELTARGGIVVHGRSDAVLNPGGVRIGTAEIYRIVESLADIDECVAIGQEWNADTRIVLFVKLGAGRRLDDSLQELIRSRLRERASPRHVPARILQVLEVPRTISGKISEIAVREVVHGRPVNNLGALANPDALEYFKDRAELEQ
jgi:acetoacetyl-CoA synthetase